MLRVIRLLWMLSSLLIYRSVALHERAECVHPDPGKPPDRADTEPELGGRVQVPHHYPPPHVLWKRGKL